MQQSYDDVGSVVIDLGANSCFGYCGEDVPKYVVPNVAGINICETNGKSVLHAPLDFLQRRTNMDVRPVMVSQKAGKNRMEQTLNGDAFEMLLEVMVVDKLRIHDMNEHPLLFSEPANHQPKFRQQLMEIVFEKFQSPASFLIKRPVLSAFSVGRPTALVVDMGATMTTFTPVQDGFSMQMRSTEYPVGGNLIEDMIAKKLEAQNVTVLPHYCLQKGQKKWASPPAPGVHPTYLKYSIREVLKNIKEHVVECSDQKRPTVFELPDGTKIKTPWARSMGDIFFDPPANLVHQFPELEHFPGIVREVLNSINSCDVDIRKDLLGSIILTGGGSLMPGLTERFTSSLTNHSSVPAAAKVKVITSSLAQERQFSSWIGGSIVASLGSFQQMWVTSDEYKEYGNTIIERKCP